MNTVNFIQRSAKTAGLAYLLIIVTSILSMVIGPYKLMVEGDIGSTLINISENQILYRAGAVYDLLMYMGVIILSVALYRVLKPVNKSVALVALLSRFAEALIGSIAVVCSIAILIVIHGNYASDEMLKTATLVFDIKDSLMNIVFTFLGFGSILFCYNFYTSRFIPRLLAAFGILAFVLVFGESIAVLLFSVESTVVTGLPAILFEIAIGLWLLIKGINIQHLNKLISK